MVIRQMVAVVMKMEDTESRHVERIHQMVGLISRHW